jgi:hypothetical protein
MMHLCEVVDPKPISATIATTGSKLSSRETTLFSTTADTSCALTVNEGDSRIIVDFPSGAFADDTVVSYAYQLDPEVEAGTDNNDGTTARIGLERYFDLYTSDAAPLTGTATVTIDFPLELSHGQTYDTTTVKLYRHDAASNLWTTSGITPASLDEAKGVLVSSIDDAALKSEYFAVLATQLTGPVIEPTVTSGH